MSLFIDEVVEENAKLKEENKQLIEQYEILGEEWSKLLDDKISYSHLLQKYKKAIEILKTHIFVIENYQSIIIVPSYEIEVELTKEEYDLLKEVFDDE